MIGLRNEFLWEQLDEMAARCKVESTTAMREASDGGDLRAAVLTLCRAVDDLAVVVRFLLGQERPA